MLLEIIIAVLVILAFTQGYVNWNLLQKVELLETWVGDYSDRVSNTYQELKKIDSTGHFEADDEVGSIFTSIKETIEELNKYIEEETING
jgi:hypothetical protein|tara:strand:+ start:193 stop:462 length:270 start_codon:yes stop_codon:yes gene_type:complete